jgi:hypothetical protein
MSAGGTTSQYILSGLVQSAREQLLVIQTYSPECSPESPAQLAFDPYIGRRLQMFTPIRVIPPLDMQKTCDAIGRLLDGIEEIRLLKDTNELITWEVSFSIIIFASPVSEAHSSLIDCGLFKTMVTRFSCTSGVLAIFDSGRSSGFPSVRG